MDDVKTFKVVEILESGTVRTYYFKGTQDYVDKEIEICKLIATRYEMFGNEGMTMWV